MNSFANMEITLSPREYSNRGCPYIFLPVFLNSKLCVSIQYESPGKGHAPRVVNGRFRSVHLAISFDQIGVSSIAIHVRQPKSGRMLP